MRCVCQLKPDEHDSFEMLPNGNCLRAYSRTSCVEAAKHRSGWAMKNTNNHNSSVLKKSCLGVLVCSKRHTCSETANVKPAICHKARAKQIGTNQCLSFGFHIFFTPIMPNYLDDCFNLQTKMRDYHRKQRAMYFLVYDLAFG